MSSSADRARRAGAGAGGPAPRPALTTTRIPTSSAVGFLHRALLPPEEGALTHHTHNPDAARTSDRGLRSAIGDGAQKEALRSLS